MNPLNLIRCVTATLAATTLLAAQSAPVARARSAPPTEATERMQVRLAEVIAMLEEDDLTPEQRERAKAKLEEIVARLRESRSVNAPAAPAAPSATAGPAAPRAARGMAPPSAQNAPEPQEKRERTSSVNAKQPREQEPQEPQPAKAPKAPKPPKAPKAPKAEESEIYELKTGDGEARVYRLKTDGGVVELRPGGQGNEADKVKVEQRVSADKRRAEAQALQGARRKLEVSEMGEETRRKVEEAMRVYDRVRAAKVHDDDDDEQQGKRKVEAEVRAREGQTRVRALQAERAGRDAERVARDSERAERDARVEAERAAGRATRMRVQDGDRVRAVDVAPRKTQAGGQASPRADSRLRRDAGDGDDAEIRALIDDMRKEMREIRSLLQQLRRHAQSSDARPSTRAGAVGSSPVLGQPGFGMRGAFTPGTSSGSFGSTGRGGSTPPASSFRRVSAPTDAQREHGIGGGGAAEPSASSSSSPLLRSSSSGTSRLR